VIGDSILDIGRFLGDRAPDLRSAIAHSLWSEIAEIARQERADLALQDVRLLPVVPNPEKIFCIGLNYESHRRETGRSESEYPVIFTRFANSQIGHESPIIRPAVSRQLDFEGEIAVIIGKRGRAIDVTHAMEYVAGYSCYNDATIRDWQRHTHQWTPGKNFPATGGFGPWMVTADEIDDICSLTLVTWLNRQEMQRVTTDLMTFPIPDLIAYISTFTYLEPGDVICTGTPGGVGFKREPPMYMKPGDIVEVEVSRIGTLRNIVVDEAAGQTSISL
jgi:2-keto-4-pentenoate hydratase/2-oxohepta-3-ene-1,7-dioic acid hydratase in catechol pathway